MKIKNLHVADGSKTSPRSPITARKSSAGAISPKFQRKSLSSQSQVNIYNISNKYFIQKSFISVTDQYLL